MTLNEIRDDYVRSLKREFRKRGQPEPDIIDKSVAMDMSEAFQDIQRRLSVVQGYTTLTLEADKNVYNLPSNFGKIKKVMFSNLELKEVDFDEFIGYVDGEGKPTSFTMYVSGNTQQIALYPKPEQAYTLYVYYYLDLGYYSPSGDSQQDWGNFDGSVFYGKPKLPERYNKAVKCYMLGLEFPDWEERYERELSSLKQSRVFSMPPRTYKMGGYSTPKGQADMTVLSSSTTTTASTGVSSDAIPDKFYYFSYDYLTETVTKIDSSGWTADPTASASGGVITITSSESEFSANSLLITPNNTMTAFSNNASTATITPPNNTNIFCKLEQWNA